MGSASSSSQKHKPHTKKPDSKVRFSSKGDVVVRGKNSSEMTNKGDTKPPRANCEGKDAALSIFRNEDLVIEIMSFLGVRSMVTFGSCSKSLRDGLGREIKRRKELFATCKTQVQALLVQEDAKNHHPSRVKVLQAKRIRSTAEKLVDDELGFVQGFFLPNYPFKEEAQQFFVVANPESEDPPEFHMLPICFYFGNQDKESSYLEPSTQELEQAMDRAKSIVEMQDCSCRFVRGQNPRYCHPCHPFRKFERSDFFQKVMLIAANFLKYDIRAREAFRIAARKLALSHPYTQDCLHFVLHSADQEVEDNR